MKKKLAIKIPQELRHRNFKVGLNPRVLQTKILSENCLGLNSRSGAVVFFQEKTVQYSEFSLRD